MSLFVCSKSLYLVELNFHRTTFTEDNLKRISGKPGNRHPELKTGKGIATGTGIGTGIGNRIEVRFKGRKKKDETIDLCIYQISE